MPKVRWAMLYRFCSKVNALSSSAKVWKSVKVWQSYRKLKGWNFFWDTVYIRRLFVVTQLLRSARSRVAMHCLTAEHVLNVTVTLFASQSAATNQWKIVTGSTTPITCQHLLAKDDDTTPENIVYAMRSRPTNGVVMTADAESKSISNFTQHDINSRLIVFRHEGLTC